jgi:hypothetical protein
MKKLVYLIIILVCTAWMPAQKMNPSAPEKGFIISIGGIPQGGAFPKSKLKNGEPLLVEVKSAKSSKLKPLKILDFRVYGISAITNKNKQEDRYFSAIISANIIPESVKEKIKKLDNGDSFMISDMEVVFSDGSTRTIALGGWDILEN